MATDDTRLRARRNSRTAAGATGQSSALSLRLVNAGRWLEALGLAGVLLLAAGLDFYDLSRDGFGNAYYAAAVRSMSQSWHNFFFSAYNPGGFVSIDKPPAGFWLQVLSVKLFGFQGVSLLLPEALAGVVAVAVLFYLVRRRFGTVAGLLAALALAVTPISVATNRNNTIDGLLALTLLLAAWAATIAVESGRLRWLLLALALVGVGFNIKMAEALVALPAFVLAYFLAAPLAWRTRIWHLALAGLVLAVVSLSWVTTVNLVPANQRPYVGSSQHNSELELALGYNGINRLLPRRFFGGVRPPQRAPSPSTAVSRAGQSPTPTTPRTPADRFAPLGFGPPVGGWSMLVRLFSPELAGQLSWLIPFGALGFVAAAWQTRLRRRPTDQQRSLLLWGAWFVTGFLLFTFDQNARPYYMVTLAPASAALVGVGAVALWHDYRRHALRGWLLPVAIGISATAEIVFLQPFPAWSSWLTPVIAGLAGLAILVLIAARLVSARGRSLAALGGATLGVLCLFLAPAVWSSVTVTQAAPGGIASAGPITRSFGGFDFSGGVPDRAARTPPAGFNTLSNVNPALLSYLEANRGDARFLVATPSSQTASPIIIATGQPVMAMGGFSGSDPILSDSDLEQLVKDGTVRFFLLPGARTPAGTTGGFGQEALPGAAEGTGRGANSGQGAFSGSAGATGRGAGSGQERGSVDLPTIGGPSSGDAPAQFPSQTEPFAGRFGGGIFGGFGRQSSLETWVTANCRQIDVSGAGQTQSTGLGGAEQVYDCAPAT